MNANARAEVSATQAADDLPPTPAAFECLFPINRKSATEYRKPHTEYRLFPLTPDTWHLTPAFPLLLNLEF